MEEPFYMMSRTETPYGTILDIGVDTTFDLKEHHRELRAKVDEAKESLAKKERTEMMV